MKLLWSGKDVDCQPYTTRKIKLYQYNGSRSYEAGSIPIERKPIKLMKEMEIFIVEPKRDRKISRNSERY